MPTPTPEQLQQRMAAGEVVPYLGPGALAGSVDPDTGAPIPADSDSLILAMNNGNRMAERLMWEFPRAAMNVELKRGRKAVQRFLDETYGDRQWSRAPLHDWLAAIKPALVIDTNRDLQLQDSYADTPHHLVQGIARIGGTEYRFQVHRYDGAAYQEIDQSDMDPALPILFKPMGSPRPGSTYIASDADYVDYLTELMGGFAIPAPLKQYRLGRQYLFLGVRMLRDTERMLISDITYGSDALKGWAVIESPTDKERRYCKRQGIEIIEQSLARFLDLPIEADPAIAVAGA